MTVAGRIALSATLSDPTTARSMARAKPTASSRRASGLRNASFDSRVRLGQMTRARVLKPVCSRSTVAWRDRAVSPGLFVDRLEHGDRACRHNRGDCVLIDQLRMSVAPEEHAEIIEPSHETLQ